MRTAAALIVLTGGTRAGSHQAIEQAADALTEATNSQPCTPVRFTGYIPATTQPYDLPPGARVARYEADYPDA